MELCSLPVIYLGPNYDGGSEDNGDLLQKAPCMHSYTQCPQPCSRPPLTHSSAGDSWTLTSKSGSVACGITAPFSWVLVCIKFCLCPPRVYFPVVCKFWQLYGGTSLVVQMVKHLTTMQETQVQSLGWEDPLEKEMQPTPVLLPGKSHGWRSLVGCSPWGR